MRRSSRDVVRDPTTLAIGHVRQRDERGRVRDGVGLLDSVADCVDVRIVRLVRLVDGDATARSQLQSSELGKPDIGSDADGTDDEISGEDPSVGKGHSALVDGRDGRTGLDMDAVGNELVAHENRKLRIERWEDLRGGLDDRDVYSLCDEVLGHLEADEPSPDHDGRRRCDVDVGGEPCRVLNGPKRAGPVVSGDGRAYRSGAHAEHELVVGDGLFLAGERRPRRDGVSRTVDGDDLVMDPDIEPEPVEELLGGLERQVLLLFDEPADEVRQAAVGERDVTGAFEHDDVGASVKTAKTSGRRHSSRDAPDDHDTLRRLCRVRTSGHHHQFTSSPAGEPGLALGRSQFGCLLGPAVATLGRRHMTEHLLDMSTASLPGRPATVATRNGSAHTP